MAQKEARGAGEPVLSDFSGQGALYDGLIRTLDEGSFVHAYLISGPEGIGKRTLAKLMAQHMLCTAEDGKPCGVCPACVQVREGNHPDLIVERPGEPLSPEVERGRKLIPVREMRYILSLIGQHTYTGGRRVLIIEHAEKMNEPAQNALLKTLEEPPAGTVFLLLTDSPELLLTTIVSRCRSLKMHPWDESYLREVLEAKGVSKDLARRAAAVSGGSIGMALAVAADERFWQRRAEVMQDFFGIKSRGEILHVSTAWKDRKDEAEALLNDVEDMLRALLLVRLGQRDEELLSDYPQAWQRMAASGELGAFISLMDAVCDARRLRSNQVTWQAVVEKLLLRMMEERSKWST